MKRKELKAIASCVLTNTISLDIYEIDGYCDYVIAGLNGDSHRKYKLYCNTKGYYFNFGKRRYYIHDFIRIEF